MASEVEMRAARGERESAARGSEMARSGAVFNGQERQQYANAALARAEQQIRGALMRQAALRHTARQAVHARRR